MIAAHFRESLFDPYSVRDASITTVLARGDGRETLCVYFNSKNRMGGYSGSTAYGITLKGGRMAGVHEAGPVAGNRAAGKGCFDPTRRAAPFTELSGEA